MNSSRSIVLVTGASGWIGRQICEQLGESNQQFVAYNRVKSAGPWSTVYIGGLADFRSPSTELKELLLRTRTVIHCAGLAHRPIENHLEAVAMEEVNVNGTRDLIVACQQNGVKRVVYISTIGAYDWSQIPLTGASENSPLHPITAYTSTKLQGECLIQASGLDWRILRLATVFGTGDRANFARLARSLKKKNFFVPGTGAARKSVIPIDLATAIIVKMSGIEEPKHRLINVALSHAPTLREVCDGFSSVCGFRNAHSIPLVLLRTGAIAGEVISRFWPAFPLTNFTLTKLVTSTVVDNRRLVETLPDLPMPDFTDALRSFKEYYTNI